MNIIWSRCSIILAALILLPAIASDPASAGESIDDAIAHHQAVTKKNPQSIKAHCALAEAYINQYISTGKTNNLLLFHAKNTIKKAEKIDNKSALPQISWAKYAMARDKKEKAIKRAKKAAALDPENKEAQKLLEELGVKVAGKKSAGEIKEIKYTDGSKYVGTLVNGKRHGQGTYTFLDGTKYVGEWKDDKQHGHGTYIWTDGKKYVGEWKDNNRHGHGSMTLPSGTKYVGGYKNDMPSGGWFYWSDDDKTWSYVDSKGKWVHQKSKP